MRYPLLLISAWLLFLAAELLAPQSALTTVITFVNLDGAGEGFNDATPVAPVGNNTGTTLGAQRQKAAQFAADLWADFISSNLPILVDAKFDAPNPVPPDPKIPPDPFNSLDCTTNPPVIATAEPTTYHGNFAKAPKKDTWYPQALANILAGNDHSSASDIRAYFNSSVGTPQCLPDKSWYYGLDGNAQPDQFDFVTVALRELAHGLGFITTVNLTNGKKLGGFDDVFSLNLKDVSTGKLFSQMTDGERRNAIKNAGNLRWIGDKVVAAHGGDVPMYAPDPVDLNFSVSNWDGSLVPGELMVPFYSGANHDVGLALEVLGDIGWPLDPGGSVKITALDDAVKEGTTTGFLVHRTGATDQPITVHYKISGTAKNGTDYQTLLDHVDIPAGESSATITVVPFFDAVSKEKDETVIVTLLADPDPIPGPPPVPHYTLGFPSAASLTIQNNVVKFGAGVAPASEAGVPYSFIIPVSGGEEPYVVTISKGALPAGLTLSGTTITGTPTPLLAKTASFTIKVTDHQGVSVSKSYKITILKPVAITTPSLKAATKSKSYLVSLKASGGKKAYTWSETSGTLPASLTLDPATGRISGTPLPSDVGSYSLTFKVTDALGGTAVKVLTLTIS